MSPALEFVVSSELERFIASHEFLKPGDKLEGKIIEIKKNGKALINFGKFRAVANIKFPFKVFLACPQPGRAGTKKELACREIPNYKFQITNKFQIRNPNLQNKKKLGEKFLSVNRQY